MRIYINLMKPLPAILLSLLVVGCFTVDRCPPEESIQWTLAFEEDLTRTELVNAMSTENWLVRKGRWRSSPEGFQKIGAEDEGVLLLRLPLVKGAVRVEYEAKSGNPGDISLILGARLQDRVYRRGVFAGFGSNGNRGSKILIDREVTAETADARITPDRWHKVAVERSGGRLQVFIDGAGVLNCRDTPDGYPGPYLAFYVWNEAVFRHIRIFTGEDPVLRAFLTTEARAREESWPKEKVRAWLSPEKGKDERSELVTARRAPFRVLYNNDMTNVGGDYSPWRNEGDPLTDEMLEASIDEVAGTDVDVHLLSPGLGWIPWWKSSVYPDHYEWWTNKTQQAPDIWGRYMLDGGDMVQTFVDRCRTQGMAPFVSFRLNDVHHQENCGENALRSALVSRFYEEHPEYLLNPRHKEEVPHGYSGERGQNWLIPEVRAYKFAFIKELCENYDLAGMELDFLRHSKYFTEDTPTETRVAIMTEFVSDVRKTLDRTAKGGKRYLSVRVPLRLSAYDALGLDIPRLVEAGVDMFNLSGWYDTTQQSDIPEIRELAQNAAVYLEGTFTTGSKTPYWAEQTGYGTPGHPRTSDEQFYSTADLAYARGADGMSLFNFIYYRQNAGGVVEPREPPFHVLKHLGDRAWLSTQPKYYFIGHASYCDQLPATLQPGRSHGFTMDTHPGDGAAGKVFRLRIHAKQQPLGPVDLVAKLNGHELAATTDVAGFFGNPFDAMISRPEWRKAWSGSAEWLYDGINEIELLLSSGEDVVLEYIDAAIE